MIWKYLLIREEMKREVGFDWLEPTLEDTVDGIVVAFVSRNTLEHFDSLYNIIWIRKKK